MKHERMFSRPTSNDLLLHIESLEDRRMLAVLTVQNNLDDSLANLAGDGQLSLREAIEIANNPGTVIDGFVSNDVADDIRFDFGHDGPEIILLKDGELAITSELSITGDGPQLLTISAGNGRDQTFNTQDGSRVLQVDDGNDATWITVQISGVTLTGGDLEYGTDYRDDSGGAISNREHLTVADCSLLGNASPSYGGALFNEKGSLTITNSTITGNVGGEGGGIANETSDAAGMALGSVSIIDSTVSGNTSWGVFNYGLASITNTNITNHTEGSGIFNGEAATLNILSSTLSENHASNGGGLTNRGQATITDSSIIGNRADGSGGGINQFSRNPNVSSLTLLRTTIAENHASSGGGIANDNGMVTITGSTISNNDADSGGIGNGGGIYSRGDVALSISHSTITGNSANSGGGIHTFSAQAVQLHHSIVAQNDSNFGDIHAYVNGSFNLIGDGKALTGITHDMNGNRIGTQVNPIDALLGPLANNGGPTKTHALLPDSPAIDAGDPSILFDANEFDQRGDPFTRVAIGVLSGVTPTPRIDIGSYEAQAPPSADFNNDLRVDGRDFLNWQRAFGQSGAAAAGGDSDHDGDADLSDLAAWQLSYGETIILPPQTAAVASEEAETSAKVSTVDAALSLDMFEEVTEVESLWRDESLRIEEPRDAVFDRYESLPREVRHFSATHNDAPEESSEDEATTALLSAVFTRAFSD
ncbi:right-handed parallel beta-helix repeat-containing protein [Bythopirellula goksoeyrii]|uniref:Uncharacterized protein n=1 Tax=Bythopirellula goksoeyrii TaxID=1400387 RepID=A0A5B9QJM1_9BACT|nr:right-handed parallel beta-helix repeat-containing protein [Bythopirellula goksoeyrii]QEG37735.1 hypothetical protein Pr1d_50820 [Bythopirellula goksoeyrii]